MSSSPNLFSSKRSLGIACLGGYWKHSNKLPQEIHRTCGCVQDHRLHFRLYPFANSFRRSSQSPEGLYSERGGLLCLTFIPVKYFLSGRYYRPLHASKNAMTTLAELSEASWKKMPISFSPEPPPARSDNDRKAINGTSLT